MELENPRYTRHGGGGHASVDISSFVASESRFRSLRDTAPFRDTSYVSAAPAHTHGTRPRPRAINLSSYSAAAACGAEHVSNQLHPRATPKQPGLPAPRGAHGVRFTHASRESSNGWVAPPDAGAADRPISYTADVVGSDAQAWHRTARSFSRAARPCSREGVRGEGRKKQEKQEEDEEEQRQLGKASCEARATSPPWSECEAGDTIGGEMAVDASLAGYDGDGKVKREGGEAGEAGEAECSTLGDSSDWTTAADQRLGGNWSDTHDFSQLESSGTQMLPQQQHSRPLSASFASALPRFAATSQSATDAGPGSYEIKTPRQWQRHDLRLLRRHGKIVFSKARPDHFFKRHTSQPRARRATDKTSRNQSDAAYWRQVRAREAALEGRGQTGSRATAQRLHGSAAAAAAEDDAPGEHVYPAEVLRILLPTRQPVDRDYAATLGQLSGLGATSFRQDRADDGADGDGNDGAGISDEGTGEEGWDREEGAVAAAAATGMQQRRRRSSLSLERRRHDDALLRLRDARQQAKLGRAEAQTALATFAERTNYVGDVGAQEQEPLVLQPLRVGGVGGDDHEASLHAQVLSSSSSAPDIRLLRGGVDLQAERVRAAHVGRMEAGRLHGLGAGQPPPPPPQGGGAAAAAARRPVSAAFAGPSRELRALWRCRTGGRARGLVAARGGGHGATVARRREHAAAWARSSCGTVW
jgi:hypothetical protein